MKKTILTLLFGVMTLGATAIPAKPGLWKTLKLADGTEVKARLTGDENMHFYITENGERLMPTADGYQKATEEQLQQRRAAMKVRKSVPRRKVTIGERTSYIGKKKGLVILMEFKDVSFNSKNNIEKYKRILNEEGYNEGSFVGSVSDYFKAQSAGQFELDFDVVGPFKTANNRKYYGENDANGNDKHPEIMIKEACLAADEQVDFKDYDWDGDGEVDQVFVLYAGKGEADGGSPTTVWPHMWTLQEGGITLKLDDTVINTYACSNEVDYSGNIEGIGAFCHEFSHCMGFPDFYDVSYGGNFGMGAFDLMCSGCYNGDGFIPSGYTAHEKMMCGWQEPIVLADKDVTVENLLPMSEHGNTYIIYNDAHPDEYFMIENRQKTGWDADYPAKGLMITHVDFDKDIWLNNIPNTIVSKSDQMQYGYTITNTHQRMTFFHADNTETEYNMSTDLYPYRQNDSLTTTSKPAPKLFNKNSKGKLTVGWAILDIKQNSDGTMNFSYQVRNDNDPGSAVEPGETLFYESFDKCEWKGGNDDLWDGNDIVGVPPACIFDNDGWDMSQAYAANQCGRFGTTRKSGDATTPSFTIDGECLLTFRAAPWGTDGTGLNVSIAEGDATISESQFEMAANQFTDFSTTIKGQGEIRIMFYPQKRMFLDEVIVKTLDTGISTVKAAPKASQRIYSIEGRYMGTDARQLPRGIYIVGGRKVIK